MSERKTKLQFPPEYFNREERSGHMVGEIMKRVWAAELEMLAHVDEICEKYGLTYYAYWGTLLGAVRHNGFIPWDDDLDIAMKREDYNKFLEVALKELPEGYYLLNNYVEEWDNSISKLTNSRKIDFGKEYMERFHNCPFAVGIDIFPLDYIPRDEQAATEQKELLTFIGNINSVVVGRKAEAEAGASTEELAEYDRVLMESLADLEQVCGVHFDYSKSILQQLNILFDQVAGLYTSEESDEITCMFKYIRTDYQFDLSLFSEVERVPFENFMIPIPNGYHEILEKRYKNYMVPRKVKSSHGDLYFLDQIEALADALDERCKNVQGMSEDILLQKIAQKKSKIGEKCKVVLMCNDTLQLIKNDALAIKKLEYALNTFEENPDILLLWKTGRIDMPQMNVLSNLVPQFSAEYRMLVKSFQERMNCILIEGISMEKILQICDAYYGDENDISRDFQSVKKPVMIQDYNICEA